MRKSVVRWGTSVAVMAGGLVASQVIVTTPALRAIPCLSILVVPGPSITTPPSCTMPPATGCTEFTQDRPSLTIYVLVCKDVLHASPVVR
ncbi:MAG: hypothetical protein QOK43_1037 [Acidimicrobiaceae bacterium]|nr:hypothetical protein [Acidimicrobiaceae bacterium]